MKYLQFKVEKTTALWNVITCPHSILTLNPECKNVCINPQISQEVYNIMHELMGVLYSDFMDINIHRSL